MKEIMLCAICNISSGTCKEDCAFCTQSAKHKADIERFKQKPIESIVKEAKIAKQNKALGFCLVTAGKGMDDKKLDFVTRAAYAVKKEIPDFMLIGCNGTATLEQLKELKNAGVDVYNHNLETSRDFYSKICTSHSWDERYQTNLNAKEAGLYLCTGGIFGLGESNEDRASFLKSIKSLKPFTSPLNFFISNPSLPLQIPSLEVEEALSIIKNAKHTLGQTILMIAGGREGIFKNRQGEIFEAGAGAIVVGDYLTTKGASVSDDINMIQSLGYQIATQCHG